MTTSELFCPELSRSGEHSFTGKNVVLHEDVRGALRTQLQSFA
jgi:hypothetical protein